MKIIQNRFSNLILAKGFAGITLWPFIFLRTGSRNRDNLIRHERIHGRQQLEMLIVPFFLWYGVEFLIRFIRNRKTAYRNISLEREAYDNDRESEYLRHRKPCHTGSLYAVMAKRLHQTKTNPLC